MKLFKKILESSGLLTPYGDKKGLKDLAGLVDINKLTSSDWIDLGLPSGLLWATRNVGATSPTDDGDSFVWGGSTPNGDPYDFDSYHYKFDEQSKDSRFDYLLKTGSTDQMFVQNPPIIEDHDKSGFTKYSCDGYYGYDGFTDNLTILESIDDAATAHYGGRTPTKEEWQELCDNTTSRWIAMDGLWGHCFTGPNGNTLFLPASSYNPSEDSEGEIIGLYWSSSLVIDSPDCAWTLRFDSENVDLCESGRIFRTQYVHAVRSAH